MLAVYRSMSAAEVRTYAKAKLDPDLEKYAADKALSDIKATLFYYQQQGTIMKGTLTRSPKVTAISIESDPLKATVVDCVDSSAYDKVSAKTGKAVGSVPSGPRRHVVTSTAERSKTGDWKIYASVIDRERTC